MSLDTIDRGIAVLLGAACAAVVVAGLAMRGDAGVFPVMTGGLGLLACIALAAKTFGGGAADTPAPDPLHGPRFLVWSLCVALLLLLLRPLGTFVAFPLFLVVTLLLLARLRLRTVLLVSLAFTAVIFLVFDRLLEVPLPEGLLVQWLDG